MNKKNAYLRRIMAAIFVSVFIALLATTISLAAPSPTLPSYPTLPPYYPIFNDYSSQRRGDMMAIAEAYLSYKWRATGQNDKHGGGVDTPDYPWCLLHAYIPWGCWQYPTVSSPDLFNIGIPYYLGGRTPIRKDDMYGTLNDDLPNFQKLESINRLDGDPNLLYFDQRIQNNYNAGDIITENSEHIEGNPAGVDCTGFVMTMWRLGSDFGPSRLAQFSRPIRFGDLQPGDIVYHQTGSVGEGIEAGHVVIFKAWVNFDPLADPVVGEEFSRTHPPSVDNATTFLAYEAAAGAKRVVLSRFRLVGWSPVTVQYSIHPALSAKTDIVNIQRIESCSDDNDCKVPDFAGVAINKTGLEYTMHNAFPRTYFNPLDVELVIDASPSMNGAGLARAKSYAKAIVDILSPGDKVGIVAFGDYATPRVDLTTIEDATTITMLKDQIDAITTIEGTSIIGGLMAGHEALKDGVHYLDSMPTVEPKPDLNRVIVLLSDGWETAIPYYDPEDDFPENMYNDDQISVLALQTDDSAANNLLQTIANLTEGAYAHDLAPIVGLLLERKQIIHPPLVDGEHGNVPATGTYAKEVQIDSAISSMNVFLSWSGAPLSLSLKQEDGIVITSSNNTDPNVVFASGSTYISYTINAPKPGTWTMTISGASGQAYDLSISALDAMDLSADTDKQKYLPGEPIKFTASIDDGATIMPLDPVETPSGPEYIQGLTKKDVVVEDPAHVFTTVHLNDEGADGDTVAHDGIYSGTLSGTKTLTEGLYNFTLQVEGLNNRANELFTREKRLSARVAAHPVVTSIVRTLPYNPVSLHDVPFTVTFSEIVKYVDVSDFVATANGISGASIASVRAMNLINPNDPESGASVYEVIAINPGSGTGTLRLDVIDDDTITDGIDPVNNGVNGYGGELLGGEGLGNGNFTNGEAYNIQNPVGGIIVTTLNDSATVYNGLCDSSCSFHEAMNSVAAGGTIHFDPQLSGGTIRVDTNPSPNFVIFRNITVDASELAVPITISGEDNNGTAHVSTFFWVEKVATLTIKNLILTKAKHIAVSNEGGILKIINTVFSDNGTIVTSSSNADEGGGAIWNGWNGRLTIESSTFINNKAMTGGAIYNMSVFGAAATITNSTFSGNSVYIFGGAVFNKSGALMTIKNSTFSGNGAMHGGSIFNAGSLQYSNSIVANSTSGSDYDCYNNKTIISSEHNLVENGFNCSPFLSTDPNLGLLANYGGFTQTLPLLSGSPAINAGDDAVCAAAPVNNLDQRGVTRPQGGHCDIGAYEKDGSDPITPTPTRTVTFTPTVTSTPFPTPFVNGIAAGDTHTCAIISGGAKCWGAGIPGELGSAPFIPDSTTKIDLGGLSSGVSTVALGNNFVCARTTSNGVKCLGSDSQGQLGDGGSNNSSTTAVNVSGLSSGVNSVAVAGDYSSAYACAVSSGAVKCWGYDYGNSPVAVNGLSSGASSVATSADHACALLSTNTVKCWGNNSDGQLGNGTTTSSLDPVTVTSLSGVSAIAVGGAHSCALLTSGAVKCWGNGSYGQLGNESNLSSTLPVLVSNLSNVSAITTGANHSCALLTSGAVKCWGDNIYGQLGDGMSSPGMRSNIPVDVPLSQNATSIAAGNNHTCALLVNGGVKCWGHNGYGEIGDGTTTDRHTPVNVVWPVPAPTSTPTVTKTPTNAATLTKTPTPTMTATPTVTKTITKTPTPTPVTIVLTSIAAEDGWILASSSSNNAGGSMNSTGHLIVGDDVGNKQFRSILSFDTGSVLPDNAIVQSVKLELLEADTVNQNMLATSALRIDIGKGKIGTGIVLQTADFEYSPPFDPDNDIFHDTIGAFPAGMTDPTPGWFSKSFSTLANQYIALAGRTQFRLRFGADSNGNGSPDQIKFYSGENTNGGTPRLTIIYTLP